MLHTPLHIGTAGWVVPPDDQHGGTKTHLQRYSAQLKAVEINSAFHRHHRPETYGRWAAAGPSALRFAMKMPKAITHENGLRAYRDVLDRFLA